MKNIKKNSALIALFGALLIVCFIYVMKSMPNIFDWDLDDE